MRPALHANILRHRSQRARRLYNRPHTFSLSRLLMIILVGAILFVPGLALTILGVQQAYDYDSMSPGQRIMFKAIGPTMCTLGAGMLFGAVVYYCCYGLGDQTRQHVSQQRGVRQSSVLSAKRYRINIDEFLKRPSSSQKAGVILDIQLALPKQAVLSLDQQSAVMSSDSKGHGGTHASIRSHHENGSHHGTPDGMTHRSSYKGHHSPQTHFTSHHHHQYHSKTTNDEEAVPLAPSENFSTIDSMCPAQPSVSITVEDVDLPRHSPSGDETELMINGGVRTDDPKV